MPQDSRGFTRPDLTKLPANSLVDLTVPGSGLPAPDHGTDQRDNRSAAHFADGWPGAQAPSLPPSGTRQRE